MINISDKLIKNTMATCINRGTLRGIGDAYKIFIDQTVQFLKNEGDELFFKKFKGCLIGEVQSTAKNEIKIQNAEKGIDNKKNEKNKRATAGDILNIKRQNPQKPKPKDDDESQGSIIENFNENFDFKKSSTDLCKILTQSIKQKVYLKEGKRIKAYSPAQNFCKELCDNLGDENMKLYFKTLAENCTFWAVKNAPYFLPVVFPQRIRMHANGEKEEQISGNKGKVIDTRGFGHQSNPIRTIARKKNRGKLIMGDFNYKGLRLDQGFEACHIWYDTTEAPPLFTFIPNVVWMPQIISRLSDEVVKNTVFPPLLKYLSGAYYGKKFPKKSSKSQGKKPSQKPTKKPSQKPTKKPTKKPSEGTVKKPAEDPTKKQPKKTSKKQPKKLLKPIIDGAWQGLIERDLLVKNIYSAEKVHEKPKKTKFSHFYIRKRLVMNTRKRIKKNIDYIEHCKKIAKNTEPLEEDEKKKALHKLYKEEKKREPTNEEGKETPNFRKWNIQNLKDQWESDPILNEKDEDADKPPHKVRPKPKGKENEDNFLKRTLNKSCYDFVKESLQQNGKKNYSDALKKMIIESYVKHNNFNVIQDLEKWLNSYYRALTTIEDKKKKQFVEDTKNPKIDMGKKYGLNKEEIERNISEILVPEGPKDAEKIPQEIIIKDPIALKAFVVALCSKKETPTQAQ